MFGLGPLEICVIGAIAVMLYGKNLPEVGRSFGKTIGEIKKTFNSLSRDLDVSSQVQSPSKRLRDIEQPQATGVRFDPPTLSTHLESASVEESHVA